MKQQGSKLKPVNLRGLVSWVSATLLLTSLPAWALSSVVRPDLRTLKRAEVVRIVNFNTLVVQVVGEQDLRLVTLLGVDPLPPQNPAWTEITGDIPLATYYSGQYLQDMLNRKEIYLEADPQVTEPDGSTPAYVWRGEMFVNQHMLYQGHGLFSGSGTNLKYASVLNEAAEVAKNQGRGIWTFFGPAPPERK